MKVLLVEDYVPLRASISQLLREGGYAVDETGDGSEAVALGTQNNYALAVIDIMLPSRDGLEVLSEMRRVNKETGVLIITARDAVDDRIRGLDAGADDYLVKPFSLEELMARIRALMRRASHTREPIMRVGDLELDTKKRVARRGGATLELTMKEYQILELLVQRSGQVVSRADVWDALYDEDEEMESNVIDVFVAYLRKKIERPDLPKLIHTRRGHGYVLEHRPDEN